MFEDIFWMYDWPEDPNDIEGVRIKLASPDKIREWSYGEVKKAETINYRTFKPEKDGLFCAKIFGPIRDYECLCGKYKKIKHRGVICDKCGVEVTTSKVRRERMGHIELAVPVAHIWYVKVLPSKIATLLGISVKDLERVIYYESYIVVDPGETPLKEKELLSEARYKVLREQFGDAFDARMGAEAIRDLLRKIDLDELAEELRIELRKVGSGQVQKEIMRRLRLVEAFRESGNRPEWMILEVIPVLPPDLRPLVQLDGGRFATSDLNDLYRRVINRNNRLKRLLELKAPEIIIRNEKRMLQEAVDALIDNGRMARPIKVANNRPLKSLTDILRGKQGRFRQNLLGKRVDYSGRSVIVVGPELKLNQCGLPKIMALELFKPFIYHKLIHEKQIAATPKRARKLVEQMVPEVWDALEEVVKEHPVMLNRAPTLHRPSIQAFEPILVEEKAIKIHPLVCVPYNADFDGDQMAVHVPVSLEAQIECYTQIMANHNILSPAHGKPLMYPTQDMVLGLYYMSKPRAKAKGEGKIFSCPEEVQMAYDRGAVHLQAKIKCRINGKIYDTTVGRVLFYLNVVPSCISFEEVNRVYTKGFLQDLVFEVVKRAGNTVAVEFLDKIKDFGFELATKSGISISVDDMEIPPEKWDIIRVGQEKASKAEEEFRSGLITYGERYNRLVGIWNEVTDTVTNKLMEMLKQKDEEIMEVNGFNEDGTPKDFNSIYTMAISAARGGVSQIKQLAGMRGLMAKPSGEIIETPVLSNFREGLSMLEYFVSTHGARKGLADTALKTANAGYLTRKLVDVAHHEIVVEHDCGTVDGIRLEPLVEAGKTWERISDRIVGRVCLEDIKDPFSDTEEYIVRAGEVIDEEKARRIEEAGIKSVLVRSVLTCNSRDGVCAMCYGWDLSRRKIVDIGEAVGVIAAQSIGEPGTQLTMRTFHIGGTATITEISQYEAKTQGITKYENIRYIYNRDGQKVVINRNGEIKVVDEKGKEKESYPVKYGAIIKVEDGQVVKPGDVLVEWDPYTESIISEHDGRVKFGDLIEGVTIKEERDEITGLIRKIVVEPKGTRTEKLQPRISIKAAYRRSNISGTVYFENIDTVVRNEKVIVVSDNARIVIRGDNTEESYQIPKGAWLRVGEKQYVEKGTILAYWVPTDKDTDVVTIGRYPLPVGAYIQVKEGDVVFAGDVLAKTPREMAKTKDITGGLPKVVQLFEARRPKGKAIISEIDGFVELGPVIRGKRRVLIKGEGEVREYQIPTTQHVLVKTGDYVRAGDKLVDGDVDPHDYLETFGVKKTQLFLLDEVQKIYRSQGVEIHDKHIEIIIRQMFKRVRIEDPGDTKFLPGDEVDRFEFEDENRRVVSEGGRPATAKPILVGIARVAVQSDSWISAASFQETTKVLADAVVKGKVDKLKGLKENVIVGRLIPAGTGARYYRDTEIKVNLDLLGDKPNTQDSIDNRET